MNTRAPNLTWPAGAGVASLRSAARIAMMVLAAALGAASGSSSGASDIRDPTPEFKVRRKTAIFPDITRADVTLNIDVAAKRATVAGGMDIEIGEADGGAPLLDVVPPAARFVAVDGGERVALIEVTSPDRGSVMRMVDAVLAKGVHTLDFEEYALREGTDATTRTSLEGISFVDGGFEFQTDQDDTKPRHFTERFFPSGFERDPYPFKVTVNVQNATAAQSPDVMTNGVKTLVTDGQRFEIAFPEDYNTSSWFLHVIDRNQFAFATGEYSTSDGRTVPLTAYGPRQADVDLTIAGTKRLIAEIEADYGPYPQDFFLVAVNTTFNDPEEYVGAAQIRLNADGDNPIRRSALRHELLHMWFGRSARPYEGRDGWVDESIAAWRSDRSEPIELDGDYVPLAYESRYERHTPDESYDQGTEFSADLDRLFAGQGGLKPVLRAFHERYADRFFTTEDYLAFLREKAPDRAKLDELIEAKVYAGAAPHH